VSSRHLEVICGRTVVILNALSTLPAGVIHFAHSPRTYSLDRSSSFCVNDGDCIELTPKGPTVLFRIERDLTPSASYLEELDHQPSMDTSSTLGKRSRQSRASHEAKSKNTDPDENESSASKKPNIASSSSASSSASSSSSSSRSVFDALMPKRSSKAVDLSSYRWEKLNNIHVYHSSQEKGSERIGAFDMDGTLIRTASGRKFAKDAADWTLWNPSVPSVVQKYHQSGYRIVIFSNQGGILKNKTPLAVVQSKVQNIIKQLGVPVTAFLAAGDDHCRKPATGMWDALVEHFSSGVEPDLSHSFFVGDAAGRLAAWDGNNKTKKDFSASDRKFAKNVGIQFFTPEEVFLSQAPTSSWEYGTPDPALYLENVPSTVLSEGTIISSGSETQEMVIFVGFPACGKSSFYERHFCGLGYARVNQDTLGTRPKCIKYARECIERGESVVIDNTSPSVAARAVFISLAQQYDLPVRCFHFAAPLDLALHLNQLREKASHGSYAHIPRVAYYSYSKHFVPPTVSEGFSSVHTVNFVPTFANERDRRLFLQWS